MDSECNISLYCKIYYEKRETKFNFLCQLLFFLGVAAFRTEGEFQNGLTSGQWWVGTAVFTAVLATITWKGALIVE